MGKIIDVKKDDAKTISTVADIHIATFQGFFLTFLGKGFLKLLYKSYCEFDESAVIAYVDEGKILGFFAYSGNYSGLYKYMIKKRLIPFAWYAIGAFFRKPKSFMRLIGAFVKSNDVSREEKYLEIASCSVLPTCAGMGIGTILMNEVIRRTDFTKYAYISLETDADNNASVNSFYQKSGFTLARTYETREGRRMNEYRFGGKQ